MILITSEHLIAQAEQPQDYQWVLPLNELTCPTTTASRLTQRANHEILSLP